VFGTLKSGKRYDCNSKDRKIAFNNNFSEEDLESRLFELDQKDQAVAKIKSLLTDVYEVNARDRYVLVSLRSEKITEAQVLDITASLEKAYNFYVSYFKLRAPDKIITVYLAPDSAGLNKTAKLVHGATLPKEVYGYSLLTDLSLLGIAEPGYLGTLYHELFHLVVRTDLGDIPAWLDEGLASLYSTSHWSNDSLLGDKDTWRKEQLQKTYLSLTKQAVPSLTQLFSYNWQQFNGGEDINLCQASVNYALSNFLMILFQEQNKLQYIVDVYKNRRDPGGKDSPAAPGNIEILESALGYSIDSLQAQFTRWFISNYHFNLYLPGGDRPPGADELTDESPISDYKNSIRQMLDDLKKKKVPAEAGIAGFEKRLATIYNSYTAIDKKATTELESWNKRNRVEVKSNNEQRGGVRQVPPKQYTYPEPTGETKKRLNNYKIAMDKERAKMKQLYIDVQGAVAKYLRHATKKR
jgi:hypothetical protein